MKKKEILKAIAVIVIPGGIPVWLGYKVYEYINRNKNEQHRASSGDDGETEDNKNV